MVMSGIDFAGTEKKPSIINGCYLVLREKGIGKYKTRAIGKKMPLEEATDKNEPLFTLYPDDSCRVVLINYALIPLERLPKNFIENGYRRSLSMFDYLSRACVGVVALIVLLWLLGSLTFTVTWGGL